MGTATVILKLLDLMVVGAMSLERLNALKQRVQAMVAEGREPTDAEWIALFSDIDINSARLDAADQARKEPK